MILAVLEHLIVQSQHTVSAVTHRWMRNSVVVAVAILMIMDKMMTWISTIRITDKSTMIRIRMAGNHPVDISIYVRLYVGWNTTVKRSENFCFKDYLKGRNCSRKKFVWNLFFFCGFRPNHP